mmetsp:Transcript_117851/g.165649  ORF Transcript_117851/g.165649 Transcript_117851/m.165649 type:complete len:110 (-) Transcript_117851:52-381(-)
MARRSNASALALLLCLGVAWFATDAFVSGVTPSARVSSRTEGRVQMMATPPAPEKPIENQVADFVPTFMGVSFLLILTFTFLWGAFGEEPEKREYDTKPALNFELYAPR